MVADTAVAAAYLQQLYGLQLLQTNFGPSLVPSLHHAGLPLASGSSSPLSSERDGSPGRMAASHSPTSPLSPPELNHADAAVIAALQLHKHQAHAARGFVKQPPPSKHQSNALYKTELCRSWEETGQCRYSAKCQFAHGGAELRPLKHHPKYKTEVCKSFKTTGTCPYGKRCRFIHQTSVLREAPTALPPPVLTPRSAAAAAIASLNAAHTRSAPSPLSQQADLPLEALLDQLATVQLGKA